MQFQNLSGESVPLLGTISDGDRDWNFEILGVFVEHQCGLIERLVRCNCLGINWSDRVIEKSNFGCHMKEKECCERSAE